MGAGAQENQKQQHKLCRKLFARKYGYANRSRTDLQIFFPDRLSILKSPALIRASNEAPHDQTFPQQRWQTDDKVILSQEVVQRPNLHFDPEHAVRVEFRRPSLRSHQYAHKELN